MADGGKEEFERFNKLKIKEQEALKKLLETLKKKDYNY